MSIPWRQVVNITARQATIVIWWGIAPPTTNLETTNDDISLMANPNPSSKSVSVRVPENKFTIVVLYDAKGKRILQVSIQQGQTDLNLKVESLNKGIYLLLLQGNQETETLKIVRN